MHQRFDVAGGKVAERRHFVSFAPSMCVASRLFQRSVLRSHLPPQVAAAAAAPRRAGSPARRAPAAARLRRAAVSGSLALRFDGRRRRLANVPFANLVIVAARLEIEMDVLFVIAVGAWAEHGCKPRAGGRADSVPPILIDVDVGETKLAAVGELEIAHVERIGAAVLAHLCGAHIIAAAAIIGARNCRARAAAAGLSATAQHPRAPNRRSLAPSGSVKSRAALP